MRFWVGTGRALSLSQLGHKDLIIRSDGAVLFLRNEDETTFTWSANVVWWICDFCHIEAAHPYHGRPNICKEFELVT